MASFQHIFEGPHCQACPCPQPTETATTVLTDATPAKELKMDKKLMQQCQSLEYDKKKQDAAKEEKAKPRKYSTYLNVMNATDVETMLQEEIQHTMVKRSWRTLDMCLKWRLIESYLDQQDIKLTAKEMKKVQLALKTGLLKDVTYDQKQQKLTSLNYTLGVHCL